MKNDFNINTLISDDYLMSHRGAAVGLALVGSILGASAVGFAFRGASKRIEAQSGHSFEENMKFINPEMKFKGMK